MSANSSSWGSTLAPHVPSVLAAMPKGWRGTTFKNSELLGREVFSDRLVALISSKAAAGEVISEGDLVNIGNAEDYFRVASNVSTMLELVLAEAKGWPVSQVFSFASVTMPVVAVAFTASGLVHLYVGDEALTGAMAELVPRAAVLKQLSGHLVCHKGAPGPHPAGEIVLALESAMTKTSVVDGIIGENVLYIANPKKINIDDILVIRKRMATPATTPMAETTLQQLAGIPVTADIPMPSAAGVAEFYAHLQKLCGTALNTKANPVIFTAGLPSLCSLFMALIGEGGADILMSSTAYGGCSQLADLMHGMAPTLRKSTFDIQGDVDMVASISGSLEKLASMGPALNPTTVLFIECPTNPAMKVPEVNALALALKAYQAKTGKAVLLLVDTTFAPNSNVLAKIKAITPELPAMVFISMSKSVSRGLTTAGGIVANHTAEATHLVHRVERYSTVLDTKAKADQMHFLVANHKQVEERCTQAYNVAAAVGEALQRAVKGARAFEMPLQFVTPAHAADGFTSSSFSFNLPSPAGATYEINAGLAQRFVDLLCIDKQFKPCVSFGQDNGLVYCTVPATSTQGAIKEEDKAKQAVGGVQIARLSFPPTCDLAALIRVVENAVATVYQPAKL